MKLRIYRGKGALAHARAALAENALADIAHLLCVRRAYAPRGCDINVRACASRHLYTRYCAPLLRGARISRLAHKSRWKQRASLRLHCCHAAIMAASALYK